MRISLHYQAKKSLVQTSCPKTFLPAQKANLKPGFLGKAHSPSLARKVQDLHDISGKKNFCPKCLWKDGTLRGMANESQPIKNKPVIITAAISGFFLVYKVVDAAGNAEYLLQKAGLSEPVAKFLGSSRGIDLLVAASLLVFLVVLIRKLNQHQVLSQPEANEGKRQEVSPTPVKEPCPDKWLHDIAKNDKNFIDQYVKVLSWTLSIFDL